MIFNRNYICLLILLISSFLVSCNSDSTTENAPYAPPEPSGLSGKILAETHCGSCHAFTEPALLPKDVWEKSVLPEMGYRLGHGGYLKKMSAYDADEILAVINAGVYPEQPLIADEDWQKIVNYYIENAPDALEKTPVRATQKLDNFIILPNTITDDVIMTTQYDYVRNTLFIGSGSNMNKTLSVATGEPIFSNVGASASPVVSKKNHPKYGEVSLEIGIMDPSDLSKGKLKAGKKTLLENLHRPVDFVLADINEDGTDDFVIANFGNLAGNVSWYDGNTLAETTLLNEPGARVIHLLDFDKDGKKDLVILMTQGREGVVFLKNMGKGKYKAERLLDFPPVYGSSYVDVLDFDKDGDYDIIYSNGDNADYSPIAKPYHGVRIFKNNGKNKFSESYFYAINGASKVLVADFDNDGDNDMGVISYFPNRSQNEGFMYFEQTSNLKFIVKTKTGVSNEKWLTLDYGDFNQDGYLDFVLGSYKRNNDLPPKIGSLVLLMNKGN